PNKKPSRHRPFQKMGLWCLLTTVVTTISGCSPRLATGNRNPLLKEKGAQNGAVVSRLMDVGSRMHPTNRSKKRFMCSRFRQQAPSHRSPQTVERRRCGPRMERSFFIWKLKTQRLADFVGTVRLKNLKQSHIG